MLYNSYTTILKDLKELLEEQQYDFSEKENTKYIPNAQSRRDERRARRARV